MRRHNRPLDSFEIAELLSLELLHCEDLLDTLIKFGFILPVEDGDKFTMTPAGSDLISPKPLQPPWEFDPTLQVDGDRLPTYVAFDLLPLRTAAANSPQIINVIGVLPYLLRGETRRVEAISNP